MMRYLKVVAILIILYLAVGCTSKSPPQKEGLRIISLAPSITEILFELGLGKNLVGVTSYCNYPRETLNIEKVGTFSEPNIEKILVLNPDLIFTTGLEQQPVVEKLKKLRLNVVVIYPSNIEELFNSIKEIGKITKTETRAERLIDKMKERIDRVKAKVTQIPKEKRKKVFVELWYDPITTAGPGSCVDELIELAGGINIAYDLTRPYSMFNPELVIARNPDCIILGYMALKDRGPDGVMGRFGWGNISAVKNRKVFSDIDPDLLVRPGPRLVEGLEELYERLYER